MTLDNKLKDAIELAIKYDIKTQVQLLDHVIDAIIQYAMFGFIPGTPDSAADAKNHIVFYTNVIRHATGLQVHSREERKEVNFFLDGIGYKGV